MEEGTSRRLLVLFTAALVVLGAIQAGPVIVSLARGVPPSAVTAVVTIGFVAFLGVLAGLVLWAVDTRAVGVLLRSTRRGAPSPEDQSAPPDLVRDVLAVIPDTVRVWSDDGRYADSFSYVSQNFWNAVATGVAASSPPSNARLFAEQANGVMVGWRTRSSVESLVVDRLRAIGELGMGMRRDELVEAVGLILALSIAGASTANAFAQSGANVGDAIPGHIRREWRQFIDKANRLSENVGRLAEKVKRTYSVEVNGYIPPVRDL